MKNQDPPVIMAKVDATQESELGQRFGVTGYPTLKIFKKGRAIEYTGERNSEYGMLILVILTKVTFYLALCRLPKIFTHFALHTKQLTDNVIVLR